MQCEEGNRNPALKNARKLTHNWMLCDMIRHGRCNKYICNCPWRSLRPSSNAIYLADSLQCFTKKYLPSQLAAAIKRGLKNADEALEVTSQSAHSTSFFRHYERVANVTCFYFEQ